MNQECKIIIVSLPDIDKLSLAQRLVELNDSLSIGETFTTNVNDYNQGLYSQYINIETLVLSYKNNALFSVKTHEGISTGITIDEYYNNSIFMIDIDEFNMISDSNLGNNIIIVWIDSNKHKGDIDMESIYADIQNLENRFELFPHLYFLNESVENMANIIIKYLSCTNQDDREQILAEYE